MIPSSSQSQMSTSESIEDQRFAELLKPIKDLTQNWEVTYSLPQLYCKPKRKDHIFFSN